MLTYIELRGFKSFLNLSLHLEPINVLIGANGSGKSNFLSFFELLAAVTRQGLAYEVTKSGGVSKYLYQGREVTNTVEWALTFGPDLVGYDATLESGATQSFMFARELVRRGGAGRMLVAGGQESMLHDEVNGENKLAPPVLEALNGIATYHFHDTGINSPLNQPSSTALAQRRLRRHGENIAGFLYRLREDAPRRYHLLRATIQSIAPYFLDFVWSPIGKDKASLGWRSRHSDEEFIFTDLSDGTQRFVALCCVFFQRELPGTIIIDEPELGLHPFAVAKLVGLLRSAVGAGSQVITATQSAAFVDYFQPEEVITTDQLVGASQLQRLAPEALSRWLEDYTLGDLWSQSIISEGQVRAAHE